MKIIHGFSEVFDNPSKKLKITCESNLEKFETLLAKEKLRIEHLQNCHVQLEGEINIFKMNIMEERNNNRKAMKEIQKERFYFAKLKFDAL